MAKSKLESRVAALSPAKRALLDRLSPTPASGGDRPATPASIVGMACRFPGAASVEEYWRLLDEGRSGLCDTNEAPPTHALRDSGVAGGLLRDIDCFDADFFEISAREATAMDPQHRLLLQTTWHALEDAGIAPARLKGCRAGVFLAIYQRDYQRRAMRDSLRVDAYTASGCHHSIAAGRLSYFFDLRGPSLVIDTACSSSLVALDAAARSLASGECDLAIVGAANLTLDRGETHALRQWGVLSRDERCKTFSEDADGFVRGEGVGVLVLTRQTEASRWSDRVRAVVLGSAVSQDGKSNGLTAPNGLAQRDVMMRALHHARLDPSRVSFVEAHGTGTKLGDPIEVEALAEVYGRTQGPACWLGAVKTNIGHLEAAAGMAGVIKTVLCLEHGRIVPNLHFARLNPAIELDGTRLRLPSSGQPWPKSAERIAAVSAFGMGGTNAHVLLKAAIAEPGGETPPQRGTSSSSRALTTSPPLLLALSGRTLAGLRNTTQRYLRKLQSLRSDALGNGGAAPEGERAARALCAAAALRREHHAWRLAVSARDVTDLRAALESRLAGSPQSTRVLLGKRSSVVFVFPGQGGQWPGMGRELLQRQPAFRAAMIECAAALEPHLGCSVVDLIEAAVPEQFGRIELVQPMLFALQVSLAALLDDWGIECSAVVGHSMGEVAAATVAGALPLEQAAQVIARRSQLMSQLRGQGAMLAVGASATDTRVRRLLGRDLCVAAINSPHSCVLSGELLAIERAEAGLGAAGVQLRRLAVEVASHNPLMDRCRDVLRADLAGLSPRSARVPFYSTVCGGSLDGQELGPEYWHDNLRRPVLFWQAILASLDDGCRSFVELCPHPNLLPALEEIFEARNVGARAWATGRRDFDPELTLHQTSCALYERGASPNWKRLFDGQTPALDAPLYEFEKKRFWLDDHRDVAHSEHPLLGVRTELSWSAEGPEGTRSQPSRASAADSLTRVWTGAIDPMRARFLVDHHVEQSCVLPGTGSVELVMAALAQCSAGPHELAGVVFQRPIVAPTDPTPAGSTVTVQLRVWGDRFEIWGRDPGAEWTRRVYGRHGAAPPAPAARDVRALLSRATPRSSGPELYARLNATGNYWGPAFQAVTATSAGPDGIVSTLVVPASIEAELGAYVFHPAVLDACGAALFEAVDEPNPGPVMLAGIERARIYGSAARVYASVVEPVPSARNELSANVNVLAEDGAVLAQLIGLRLKLLHRTAESTAYHLDWSPKPLPQTTTAPVSCTWVLGGDDTALITKVATELEQRGERCLPVSLADLPAQIASRAGNVVCLLATPHIVSTLDTAKLEGPAPLPQRAGSSDFDGLVSQLSAVSQLALHLTPQTRLSFVLRCATPNRGDVDPAASAVWGLLRSFAAEHPDCFGRIIDLRVDAAQSEHARLVVDELLSSDDESLVAHTGAGRHVARLRRAPEPAPAPLEFDTGAAYLISGGLGGVGLQLARHWVGRGARHLVLVGRSPLPPRNEWAPLVALDPVRSIIALERLGAQVHVVHLDVSDRVAVSGLAEAWQAAQRPPIRGIAHAAGVQQRHAVAELNTSRLAEALRAKVLGANALWGCFGSDLDFFISFTSAATLIPSPLLGAYAAANAYLDGFAQHWSGRGFRVSAIAWGLWQTGGMSRRYAEESGRALSSMRSLDADLALQAMDGHLASRRAHLGLMAVDWNVLRSSALARDPSLRELLSSDPPPAFEAPAAHAKEPQDSLQYLLLQLGRLLRCQADGIDPERSLIELGLDSLLALDLRNRILSDTGAALPIVGILRSPSVESLAERLDSLRAAEQKQPTSETQPMIEEIIL